MKVLTVIGARPQFIKASIVSRRLAAEPSVTEYLVHTGQHYDDNMSQVFFDELDIPPPHRHLGIAARRHGAMTGRMLEAIEEVILEVEPDWLMVYGDTNSTLAAALAAAKLHVPVAHVEAGLRSFNRRMPEEINRVLTDHLSAALFAPTEAAVDNLHREGVAADTVHLVGDVMYDVCLHFTARSQDTTVLDGHGLEPGGYALATVHRAENTDDAARLEAILRGLVEVAKQLPVVFPLHPRTRQALERVGLLTLAQERLVLVPPVGYGDMAWLERHAAVIATDSGGVQKEAYFHRVPCVTLRDETEWIELVEHGWNVLVPPTDATAVGAAVLSRIGVSGRDIELYGGGAAAEAILALLQRPAGGGR